MPSSLLSLLFLMCLGAEPAAKTWPGFLGQGATLPDAESLPLTWTDSANVAWKVPLPGKGQSSPVIWGDLVVVTSIEGTMKEHCHVTAFSLSSGIQLWDYAVASSQPVRSNYFQSRSAPTPLIDEKGVYAFFETGILVGLTHQGERRWERSLTEEFGPFESTIGLAASPAQSADRVFVLVDHEGPSYLLAVRKETGETAWKTDRDSRVSYASPSLVPVGDTQHLVCSSAGSIDGYDPATGELLWSHSENVGGNRSATPLAIGPGRFVMAASPGMHNENEKEARKTNGVMVIEKTETGFAPRVLWRTEEAMPQFNSPLVHKGLAYWVNRVGVVFCFDAETGEKKYAKRIAQGCWATPVGVDDRIYIFGKDGVTTILAAGPEFEVLAENTLWDPTAVESESNARNRAAGREPGSSRNRDHSRGGLSDGADKAQPTTAGDKTAGEKSEAANPEPAAKPVPEKEPAAAETAAAAGRSDAAPTAKETSGSNQAGERRPGRPRSPDEEAQARAQGEGRFADPVQYGVAIIDGHIVIRTGSSLYCLRNLTAK